jgi:predicted membrane protein
LWRAALILSEKSILDLRVNFVKPLLGALGLHPICFHLGLELRNPIFGRAKLVRKPLRRIYCMSAVLLGNIGSFVEKMENRLTGLVELCAVVVTLTFGRPRKWNYVGTHC